MKRLMLSSAIAAALALASCKGNGSGAVPQGQVVATVDGKEITTAELNQELSRNGASSTPTPEEQQQALQRLILRRLLVSEAEKRGVDKLPQTSIMVTQAQDMAKVQALAASLSKEVPKVSDDEAAEYVRANPANFAQRKLLFLDQLVAAQVPPNFEKQLEPLHTLADAGAAMKRANIVYHEVGSVLDTAGLAPKQAAQVSGVSQNDIFFDRSGKALQVSAIVAERVVPLEGSEASKVARNILTQRRSAGQVQGQLAEIVKYAKKRILLNPAYSGKPPPAK
jgi:EpsD family peptidyl-prolyl cis-trans isomerase